MLFRLISLMSVMRLYFFEIDSFLPVRPQYEFLRSSCFKHSDILGDGFRLKTRRFKGQYSQGLVLQIGDCPELDNATEQQLEVGSDVTEILGVREWEDDPVDEKLNPDVIGNKPSFVPTSDETRIQVGGIPLIQEFAGKEYYISTKMDGSSHFIAIDMDGNFHAGGHHRELRDNGKGFWKLVNERHLEEKLRDFYETGGYHTIAVIGEYCAPGVQKNRIGLRNPEWYIFTVMINGERLGLYDM